MARTRHCKKYRTLSISTLHVCLFWLTRTPDTLRVVTFDPPSAPEDEDEPNAQYDFDPASENDHYTRFPVHNPVQFLRSCIDRVRSLEWLPRHVHGPGVVSTHHEGSEVSLPFTSVTDLRYHNLTFLCVVHKSQEDTDRGVWMARQFQTLSMGTSLREDIQREFVDRKNDKFVI